MRVLAGTPLEKPGLGVIPQTPDTNDNREDLSMNVFLWIVQAVLAALFAMAGLVKAVQAKDKLVGRYPWMQDVSQARVRFIGVLELAGAIGLIAPAATGIASVLTPTAGAGLAVMMVLAAATHVRRKEPSGVAVTVILFALTALVAWSRFGPYGG